MAKVSFGSRLGKGLLVGSIKKIIKSEAASEVAKGVLKKVIGNADLLDLVISKIKPADLEGQPLVEQLVQATVSLPEDDKGRNKALAVYVEKHLEGQLVDVAMAVVEKAEKPAAKRGPKPKGKPAVA